MKSSANPDLSTKITEDANFLRVFDFFHMNHDIPSLLKQHPPQSNTYRPSRMKKKFPAKLHFSDSALTWQFFVLVFFPCWPFAPPNPQRLAFRRVSLFSSCPLFSLVWGLVGGFGVCVCVLVLSGGGGDRVVEGCGICFFPQYGVCARVYFLNRILLTRSFSSPLLSLPSSYLSCFCIHLLCRHQDHEASSVRSKYPKK